MGLISRVSSRTYRYKMTSGLKTFLQKCRQNIKNVNKIVVGNEALDMDTAAMTISYSYLLSEIKNELHLPILNIKSDLYHLKTEVKYVLTKCGIQKTDLIFLNDLNADGCFETTLVDCNVYKGELSNLYTLQSTKVDCNVYKFDN